MHIASATHERTSQFCVPSGDADWSGDALIPDNGAFHAHFNRTDFLFNHGLAHHPMFELPALAALAERIPKYQDFVYWQNGRVKVDDRWGTNPAPRLSLDQTIDGIANNDSLVILKHAEQDPVYGPLLQAVLQRMFLVASPAAQADIVLGESLIFINSPHRNTAYHLDLESSSLLQIAGEKWVHVGDANDRSLTAHIELENHCNGDANGALFKPERQEEAHLYHLTPGLGVHFPSTAPHWVENGAEVSVSININYDLISAHQRLQRIYRVNRMIRRLGLEPTAPGISPFRDALKTRLAIGVSAARKLLRRSGKELNDSDSYPVWRPARARLP